MLVVQKKRKMNNTKIRIVKLKFPLYALSCHITSFPEVNTANLVHILSFDASTCTHLCIMFTFLTK